MNIHHGPARVVHRSEFIIVNSLRFSVKSHCCFLGQINDYKVACGIEIVLTALVNDSKVIVPGSRFVGKGLIDIAKLEIRLAIGDANRELNLGAGLPNRGSV